jgi:myo-inositol-1(or 4)-monophosphatase
VSGVDRARALAAAEEAARTAGEVLLARFGRIDRARLGRKSSRRDLVTEADVESERAIVRLLRERFPEHAIEAEEEVRDAERGRPRWFLDPLDGTVNFVQGLPLFAVSIALWADGVPEVAVVHAPWMGECFTAARGEGAFLDGRRLAVSDTAELGEAVLATGFPYRRGELANDNLGNFSALFHHVRGLRRLGSAALDLAWTAAGRFDGFWELHLAPHDVAAGALLVREAGGLVTDLDGGDDWLRGGHILAAGPALHAVMRARLRR